MLLSFRKSIQGRFVHPPLPSGFGTNIIGELAGDFDLRICPFLSISSRYFLRNFSSSADALYRGLNLGVSPGMSSISWSHGWCLGKADGPVFSSKRCSHCWYSSGILESSSLLSLLSFSTRFRLRRCRTGWPGRFLRLVRWVIHNTSSLSAVDAVSARGEGVLTHAYPSNSSVFCFQLIAGLCFSSQGSPKMTS